MFKNIGQNRTFKAFEISATNNNRRFILLFIISL